MTNSDFYKRVGCVLFVILFLIVLFLGLLFGFVYLVGSNISQ